MQTFVLYEIHKMCVHVNIIFLYFLYIHIHIHKNPETIIICNVFYSSGFSKYK